MSSEDTVTVYSFTVEFVQYEPDRPLKTKNDEIFPLFFIAKTPNGESKAFLISTDAMRNLGISEKSKTLEIPESYLPEKQKFVAPLLLGAWIGKPPTIRNGWE